jgi:hypothetical protein
LAVTKVITVAEQALPEQVKLFLELMELMELCLYWDMVVVGAFPVACAELCLCEQ